MSLINKVLTDLEARDRAAAAEPNRPVLEGLRPAPTEKTRRVLVLSTLTVAVAVMAGGFWWVYSHRLSSVPMPVSAVVPKVPAVLPAVQVATPSVPVRVVAGGSANVIPSRPAPPVVHKKINPSSAPPVKPRYRSSSGATLLSKKDFVSSGRIEKRPAVLSARAVALVQYRGAIRALQSGHPARARGDLRSALHHDPRMRAPRILLAALEAQAAHLTHAAALLKAGLVFHPMSVREGMLLAQVQLRQGVPHEAVLTLAPLVRSADMHERFLALLAAAQSRADDWQAAQGTYTHALHLFPRNGLLWVGLAVADMHRGDPSGARYAFGQAQGCSLPPPVAAYVHRELVLGGT